MRAPRGFSLIELLIVVAIILIVAAIAIPNLLRARMTANTSSAAASVRSINTAEVSYSTTYPTVGFSQSLTSLGPNTVDCATTNPTTTSACLIDEALGCSAANGPCLKSGFFFYLTGNAPSGSGPNIDYEVDAAPVGWYTTGIKNLCSASDAVIREYSPSEGATASEPGNIGSATCVVPPWQPIQ